MNISFEHIEYLWILLPVFFAAVFTFIKAAKIRQNAKSFINENNKDLAPYTPNQIYLRTVIKTVFRSCAWICLVLALAGMSWGSVSTPVQKNGKAVSFVFDISYSMKANDAPSSLTRLDASKEYARMLMDYMNGISISCVIAKGEGITAIPQTEDFESIYSLLDVLSPEMMTAKGSSLGKGIEAAIGTFNPSSSRMPVILLFTDGDETDNGLTAALNKAVRAGINVCIIGFGSVRETDITAGDGTTSVKTALREEKIKSICQEVNRKNQTGKDFSFIKTSVVNFVDATEAGSAVKVINLIKNVSKNKKNLSAQEILSKDDNPEETVTVAYEMQSVNRHRTLILCAFVLFIISLICSEFSVKNVKALVKLSSVSLIPLMLTSCGTDFNHAKKIFESTMDWYQKDYNKAISGFTEVIDSTDEDDVTKQYALYGLSVTYLMQNEKNASLDRLDEISPDAPDKIKFASYYNSGIIAQREGDYEKAIDCFKLALLVSPEDVNAKINLELSEVQETQKARDGGQEMMPSSENKDNVSDAEKTIFNRIRENEQKQWKNYETPDKQNSVLDY